MTTCKCASSRPDAAAGYRRFCAWLEPGPCSHINRSIAITAGRTRQRSHREPGSRLPLGHSTESRSRIRLGMLQDVLPLRSESANGIKTSAATPWHIEQSSRAWHVQHDLEKFAGTKGGHSWSDDLASLLDAFRGEAGTIFQKKAFPRRKGPTPSTISFARNACQRSQPEQRPAERLHRGSKPMRKYSTPGKQLSRARPIAQESKNKEKKKSAFTPSKKISTSAGRTSDAHICGK